MKHKKSYKNCCGQIHLCNESWNLSVANLKWRILIWMTWGSYMMGRTTSTWIIFARTTIAQKSQIRKNKACSLFWNSGMANGNKSSKNFIMQRACRECGWYENQHFLKVWMSEADQGSTKQKELFPTGISLNTLILLQLKCNKIGASVFLNYYSTNFGFPHNWLTRNYAIDTAGQPNRYHHLLLSSLHQSRKNQWRFHNHFQTFKWVNYGKAFNSIRRK